MREFKFRAWDEEEKKMHYDVQDTLIFGALLEDSERFKVTQYTGLKDKNGKEIYEGDIIQSIYDENYRRKQCESDMCHCGGKCYLDEHPKYLVEYVVEQDEYGISNAGFMLVELEHKDDPEWLRTYFVNTDADITQYEVIGNIYEGEMNE